MLDRFHVDLGMNETSVLLNWISEERKYYEQPKSTDLTPLSSNAIVSKLDKIGDGNEQHRRGNEHIIWKTKHFEQQIWK